MLPSNTGLSVNRVQATGRLIALGAIRHTPAGVPVIEFSLSHRSEQEEAGGLRMVECEIDAVAVGAVALTAANARLGEQLMVEGFLAARSLKRRTLLLHVNRIEFQEGYQDGIQAP